MHRREFFSGVAVALSLVVASCAKKEAEPPPQNAQGFQQGQPGGQPYGAASTQPYGAAPQGTGPAPSATAGPPPAGQPTAPQASGQPPPGQVPTLGAVGSPPNVLESIIAGALAAGAATLSPMTGGELGPIEQGIKMRVEQEAKGMKPEGQLMSAKLQAGGHAEGSLTMQPGQCYTVLGFGGAGVFDYQLNLITSPPMPPQVLAQSQSGGVAPTIGPGDQCIRNPYPLPMTVKVDMHVLRGQGLVGAQVYRK